MTSDFIDALQEACVNEGVAFIIMVQEPDGSRVTARIGLDEWDCAGSRDSLKEDVLQALESCLEQWEEE